MGPLPFSNGTGAVLERDEAANEGRLCRRRWIGFEALDCFVCRRARFRVTCGLAVSQRLAFRYDVPAIAVRRCHSDQGCVLGHSMTTPAYRQALEDDEAANYGISFRRRSSSRNINQPDAEAIAIPITQPKVPSTTQTPYAQGKFYTVKTDLRNDLTSHESDTFAR